MVGLTIIGPKKLALLILLTLLIPLIQLTTPAQANPLLPTDLSYSTETTWILPGLPDLSAASGYIPHNFSHGEAVFQLGPETVHGFRPGKAYPEMYIRDIAWGLEAAQYYYPDQYLRDPIEAFLRRQYTAETVSLDGDFGVGAGLGAIGGILTPQGRSNKQTITSDEETSLIHAAYLYYQMTYNTAWLQSSINGRPIIERLNAAAEWLYRIRLDPESQLLWRGHTTDWGDVKFEKGPGYTDFNPRQDHKTASIYDQALAYLALLELAEMNAATGNVDQADVWQARAEALKKRANERLWQAERGFYLTHAHVTPLVHDFDEGAMVSISNALAVYAGLADFKQSQTALQSLEKARLAAGVNKPGLSVYPFYPNKWPNLFFDYAGMGYGNYQNGGVWDWWGGVQIKAEFRRGFAEMARNHLFQVASDWTKHPGNIIEWQSSTDPRFEGSHYYSAAAGTMGSAIIEGFFGVRLDGRGLTLQPRLGLNDAYVRVYQPATDRYVAYTYDWNQTVTELNYGTNAGGVVTMKILKLRSETIGQVTIDGQPVEFSSESTGLDTYTVFNAPSGQHRVELIKGQPAAQAAALEVAGQRATPPTPLSSTTGPEPSDLNLESPEQRLPLPGESPTRAGSPQDLSTVQSPPSVAPNVSAPTPPDFVVDPLSAETRQADLIAVRRNEVLAPYEQERQLFLIQFLSGILIAVACLTLMLLSVVRRILG
ncbi:MAG TPA: trehalase family glycosidase [Anaerolineae bacterium]|nr:trehalase family glycosidase [Anaerolineae bacterium]HMR64903.1 trehalase family glycosidase [Anaerolineae bacterium]